MNDLFSLIGIVTGVFSILGIIYIVGYWKGQVDSFMRESRECDAKYPIAEISVQLKALWDVYGVGALSNKPDLASHRSPWQLTEKGQALIPENFRTQLKQIPRLSTDHSGIASSWLVIQTLGLDNITRFAQDNDLTLPEALGLLGIYLECLRTDGWKEEG